MKVKVDGETHSIRPPLSHPIYLGAATRTPIGRFGGSLKQLTAVELASLTLTEAMKRAPQAKTPDWVILGHARQAGCGPNTARQVALFSGLSEKTPAMTINLACASGLISVITAVEKILLGQAQSIWAGGTESMSNTPYILHKARWGNRMGNLDLLDGMIKDGFHCPMADMLMGETVERYLVKELSISRHEQDQFALESQRRADSAWKLGEFSDETFIIHDKKKNFSLTGDENRKGSTSFDNLSKLRPVFDTQNGTITAGNSSGITDGAAFVHVASEKAEHTLAEVIDYEVIALDPKKMGLGPVESVQNLLKRNHLSIHDIETIELNEAFAAQVLACQRYLHIPHEKLNPKGGSIALGHPIGATGTRILTTLMHTLKNRTGTLGIATLCVSGGHGVSILIRAV